jgi:hypothetical protein
MIAALLFTVALSADAPPAEAAPAVGPAKDPPPARVVPEGPPAPALHHGADRPPRVPYGGQKWDTWGHVRTRFDYVTDPPLDETGFQADRQVWASGRWVYGAVWRPTDRVTVTIEAEDVSGAFAGDKTDLGQGADDEPFRVERSDFRDVYLTHPRNLNVAITDPRVGMLKIGAQSFTWGTGMLANDGLGDPDFGDPDQGNLNVRVLAATSPWRTKEDRPAALRGLSVFAAGDIVIRDDNAWLYRGDQAFAGVFGVRSQSPRGEVGLLGVVRWQRDRRERYRPDGELSVTTAFPLDLHGRVVLTPLSSDHRLTLEAEAAVIQGRTTRPLLEETAASGARILSAGFLGRLRFDADPVRLTVKAEVGFATGDNDPRDGVVRTFAFHSDHEIGLILFEQLLPMLTARAADRASDRSLLAVPSPGSRYTIQQGAVSNAVYVNPTVRWRPVEALDLRAGWVGAWSAGTLYDLFSTGLAGGYPVTWGGGPADKRFMGYEMDLGARYRHELQGNLALEVGAEGAVFLPGGAFATLDLPAQGTARGRFDIFW